MMNQRNRLRMAVLTLLFTLCMCAGTAARADYQLHLHLNPQWAMYVDSNSSAHYATFVEFVDGTIKNQENVLLHTDYDKITDKGVEKYSITYSNDDWKVKAFQVDRDGNNGNDPDAEAFDLELIVTVPDTFTKGELSQLVPHFVNGSNNKAEYATFLGWYADIEEKSGKRYYTTRADIPAKYSEAADELNGTNASDIHVYAQYKLGTLQYDLNVNGATETAEWNLSNEERELYVKNGVRYEMGVNPQENLENRTTNNFGVYRKKGSTPNVYEYGPNVNSIPDKYSIPQAIPTRNGLSFRGWMAPTSDDKVTIDGQEINVYTIKQPGENAPFILEATGRARLDIKNGKQGSNGGIMDKLTVKAIWNKEVTVEYAWPTDVTVTAALPGTNTYIYSKDEYRRFDKNNQISYEPKEAENYILGIDGKGDLKITDATIKPGYLVMDSNGKLYVFNGWKLGNDTVSDGQGNITITADKTQKEKNEITLIADLTPSFELTYEWGELPNYLRRPDRLPTDDNSYVPGTNTSADVKKITGTFMGPDGIKWEFIGWYKDGENTLYTSNTVLMDNNHRLTAAWKKYYTLTYDAGSINGNPVTLPANTLPAPTDYAENTSSDKVIDMPNDQNQKWQVVNGVEYKFAGWKLENDASVTIGGTVTMDTHHKLIAQWQEVGKVKVTYHTNLPTDAAFDSGEANALTGIADGMNHTMKLENETVSITYKTDLTGRTITAKDGSIYTCIGLSKSPSGSVLTAAGENTSTDVDLYAIWKKTSITVTYTDSTKKEEVFKDQTTIVPENGNVPDYKDEQTGEKVPERPGYLFEGWDKTTDAEGNITFTAKWKPIPKVNVPQTGDNSNVLGWGALLLGAAAALTLMRKRSAQ